VVFRVGRVTETVTQTGWGEGVSEAVDASPTMAAHWSELVTTAMLGTDRRDPPPPAGLIADLVDDALRATPSERMLAQVAACTAVRRAGVLPGPAVAPLQPPEPDARPEIAPAAVDRWHHITQSWPVLEDEWLLALITNGWRVAPELVPLLLQRHRGDPVRRARAEVACGPLARWLVTHRPDLAARHPPERTPPESIAELPELPIPLELESLLHVPPKQSASSLAASVADGHFGAAHRAVLVNLVARLRPDALVEITRALGVIEATSPGYGLAAILADLAQTRARMLAELDPSSAPIR
jgi:hypothetical protein